MNSEPNTTACERVQGRLAELVDGGLTPLEEARDCGHLEACADCASAYADWSAFHAELASALPQAELPADLVPGLATRLEAVRIERPRETERARVWTSLFAAAASLVALFGFEALGTAMDTGREAPLFAPEGFEVPAHWPGEGGLLPAALTDGVFTDLVTAPPESMEDPR
jgi:anti-sigma factor RsiW